VNLDEKAQVLETVSNGSQAREYPITAEQPVPESHAETPCLNFGPHAKTQPRELEAPTASEVVGNSRSELLPASDPVEAALAEAVKLASLAGQWDVVSVLARELSARRLARESPAVPSVELERARRERAGRT
jgi:hypothetical protein